MGSVPEDGALLASPPSELRLRFSEPVQPFGVGVRVVAPSGRVVATEPVRTQGTELVVPATLDESGTYLVRWRVVADDTHPARGEVAFSLGAATARPAGEAEVGGVTPVGLSLQAISRWLHFLGLTLGFGTLAFGAVALGAADARWARLWRLANWGLLLLVVAEPLALVGQTASLEPTEALDPAAVSAALDSSFGRAMGVRLGGAFLLWLLVGIAQGGSPRAVVLALVTGWVLALFDGTVAHAASLQPTWLGLLVNAAHMAAAVLWAGALVGLVALWRASEPAGVRIRRAVLGALAVLGLTGGAMALVHLTAWADLAATPYGLALLAKVALVAAALGLAALGRRRAELVVLSGVLLLAGLLVALPPPV